METTKKLIMSFSDLFDSEFKTRNKGHFSAIVRVALADGKIGRASCRERVSSPV